MIIIADYILNFLGIFFKSAIDLLPVDVSFFTISDLTDLLDSVQNFWITSFSASSHFFPFTLFFSLILLMLFMELALLTFKAIKFVVNVFRGSGA